MQQNNYNIKLPISAVAEMFNVNQRTLRIYDEEKILIPKRTPTAPVKSKI